MFSLILLYGSGFAAITDIKKREISNTITSTLFLFGIIVSLISHTFIMSFIQALYIFVIGYYMFLKYDVGAGDVKLLMVIPFYINMIPFLLICLLLSIVYGLLGLNKYNIAFAPFVFASTLGTMII